MSCAYFNTFYNAQTYFELGIKDYRESLKKSNANFPKKNFDIAIQKAETVLLKYPDSKWCDDAQYLIAVSNFYKGNYRKAKKNIEDFFDTYPDSEFKNELDIWYGRIFWKTGSPEMAVHHWQQMVDEVEDNELEANIYYSIAEVFEEIGQPDSAIHYYDKTTQVRGGSDKHGQAQYNIAEIYLEMGKMEEAIENIEKVGQFTIDNDLKQKRQILLLKIYRNAGRYEKAEKIIFKKLNDEKDKDIWDQLELELALLYQDQNDTSAAMSRLKTITENEDYKKSEATAAAYYYIGMMNLVDYHDYKAAAKNFSQVKQENKNSEFVFDADQRTKQLKRYDKINQELQKYTPLVEQIITGLNSPQDEIEEEEIDTTVKSQEEIKSEIEAEQTEVKPANIDTLKTFDDYYKNRYELAELYYFDFNFKDSAKYILKDIATAQYFNPYVEQSLYALYYINNLENNQELANNYKQLIQERNPDSPYLSFIETGKIMLPDYYEEEKEKFLQAEQYIKSDPDTAIALFKELVYSDEENPYQAKSAANIAWIMENIKYDVDSTYFWYKTVVDSFPDSDIKNLAGEKVTLFKDLVKNTEKEEKPVNADTTIVSQKPDEENMPADSSIVAEQATEDKDPAFEKMAIDTSAKKEVADTLLNQGTALTDSSAIIEKDEIMIREEEALKNAKKGNTDKNEEDLPVRNIKK
jgi:tetratricopeptide (TPR) repeat protein